MKAVATSISDPDPLKDAPSSSSVSGSTGGCISVDTFQKLNRIGEGTYGLVYRAVDKRSNQIVALKRIIMHNEMQDGFPTTTLREIQALKCINGHPNCVLLHEGRSTYPTLPDHCFLTSFLLNLLAPNHLCLTLTLNNPNLTLLDFTILNLT